MLLQVVALPNSVSPARRVIPTYHSLTVTSLGYEAQTFKVTITFSIGRIGRVLGLSTSSLATSTFLGQLLLESLCKHLGMLLIFLLVRRRAIPLFRIAYLLLRLYDATIGALGDGHRLFTGLL